jgi:hypothetical protein
MTNREALKRLNDCGVDDVNGDWYRHCFTTARGKLATKPQRHVAMTFTLTDGSVVTHRVNNMRHDFDRDLTSFVGDDASVLAIDIESYTWAPISE